MNKKVIELALIKKLNLSILLHRVNLVRRLMNIYHLTYDCQKCRINKMLQEWYGLDYVIAYFYNVYGPNQIKKHYMLQL